MSTTPKTAEEMKTIISDFLESHLRIAALETDDGFEVRLGAYDRFVITVNADVSDTFALFDVFMKDETRVVDLFYQEFAGAPTEEYVGVKDEFQKNKKIDDTTHQSVMFDIQPSGSFYPLDSGVEDRVLKPLGALLTAWLEANDCAHLVA